MTIKNSINQPPLLNDGEILIGSSLGNPSASTITAGSGVSILNGNGSIEISATSPLLTVRTVSASAPIVLSDDVVLVDTSAGSVTLTLPDPTTATGTPGFSVNIKKITLDSNPVVVSSANNIDGLATQNINFIYDSMHLVAGNDTYNII